MTSPRSGLVTAPGSRSLTAPGLVLVQIASLQLGSALAKDLFSEVGATATAALRITLAALVLCATVRPRLRSRSAPQWRAVLALGAVLAAMNLAYFHTIARLPIGIASTLELLGPLALAIVLTRRLSDLAWALLSITGLLLLTAPGADLPMPGILLGLLAAGCRAAYVLLNRRVGQLFTDWSGLALALAAGAALLAPLGAVTGGARLLDPGVLAAGAGVAILSSLLPYCLDLLVLRRISARLFGILLSLSPAVGALVGLGALGETLTAGQVVAIGLVMVASAGAVAGDATAIRRARTPPDPARARPR